jgi:hypothetical protein
MNSDKKYFILEEGEFDSKAGNKPLYIKGHAETLKEACGVLARIAGGLYTAKTAIYKKIEYDNLTINERN